MAKLSARAAVSNRQDRRGRPVPGFALDETKLHPPQFRPGIVSRTALVERLIATRGTSVLTVVAPAGYGKTILLAQWAEHRQPRVAWVSADARDNDPAVLLTHMIAALDRIDPLGPELVGRTASPAAGITDVIRLAAAIAAMRDPVALVVDNAETITKPECRDILAELALRLPAGSIFAIGSRKQVPLPISRLRAQGITLEVGVADLAMGVAEAQLLLDGAGIAVTEREVNDLVERTEGWPAGLYLAALAMNAGGSHADIAQTITGDDRFIGEYLRSEFLDRVSRSDASFLVRTSILDRLSGPLCDVTTGASQSARVLDRLQRGNLLVIPLDRRGEWYRYHHLFRDLLQAELREREPKMIEELHARASEWCEANGFPEAAIEHAQHAGDAGRVARLVVEASNTVWASGRIETVLHWIEWLPASSHIEQHPELAVLGAVIYALIGKPGDAERWATAADRTTVSGMLSDGNTTEGTLSYLHTLMCRNGIDAMSRDAESALDGLSPTSSYRPALVHAKGAAHLLAGDLDNADLYFVRAIDEATTVGHFAFVATLLTERGIIATERAAWTEADGYAQEALSILTDGPFDEYWTSALPYAWCSGVAARRGDAVHARALATRAARLRPLLTYALPVVSVQALVELARAYLALGEYGGATAVLGQASDILRHRPNLGTLPKQVAGLRSKLDLLKVELAGASALTTAELRLLPLLSTHLTLAEIAERLFVSRATVKTQTVSVYRKLGASTRGEAISRLQHVGLAPSM